MDSLNDIKYHLYIDECGDQNLETFSLDGRSALPLRLSKNGVYFYINSSSLSCRSICHSRT